jgi:hypothetical protein
MTYDGFEFKEKETLKRYVATKNRFKVATFISMASLAPALVLLILSYVEPSAYPQYLYLLFLAVSVPFSILSFQANSRLTEMINTNEVRHVGFA